MIELLVATTNRGKYAEVQAFLAKHPFRVISLQDLADFPAVIEDGMTFEENALKKARTLADFSGFVTVADDSGLTVDALDGAPGIYSARYAGEECDDAKNNRKLLDALKDVPEARRTASFVCALALCAPKSWGLKDWTVRASCVGRIAFMPDGQYGFGYDPLFFYPPLGKTFAAIDHELKATVSHRGKALQKLAAKLASELG